MRHGGAGRPCTRRRRLGCARSSARLATAPAASPAALITTGVRPPSQAHRRAGRRSRRRPRWGRARSPAQRAQHEWRRQWVPSRGADPSWGHACMGVMAKAVADMLRCASQGLKPSGGTLTCASGMYPAHLPSNAGFSNRSAHVAGQGKAVAGQAGRERPAHSAAASEAEVTAGGARRGHPSPTSEALGPERVGVLPQVRRPAGGGRTGGQAHAPGL